MVKINNKLHKLYFLSAIICIDYCDHGRKGIHSSLNGKVQKLRDGSFGKKDLSRDWHRERHFVERRGKISGHYGFPENQYLADRFQSLDYLNYRSRTPPLARTFSTITRYQRFSLDRLYMGNGNFWGTNPKQGDPKNYMYKII